ncbi:MAG: group III truncated hemoglobin [Acidimicrobiales bacterium]
MSTVIRRPPPVADLDRPDEVAEMVRRFYAEVAQDDVLGPMFNDVARVDWSEHLPKLTAFWCRALFGMDGYEGNPFRAHQLVDARERFTPVHFERWIELFEDTVDEGWVGPNADKVKAIAANVARVHRQQLSSPTDLVIGPGG